MFGKVREAAKAAKASETGISLGDTELTMHSIGQLL